MKIICLRLQLLDCTQHSLRITTGAFSAIRDSGLCFKYTDTSLAATSEALVYSVKYEPTVGTITSCWRRVVANSNE